MNHWYMLARDGRATLCTDKADAETEAREADTAWPDMGPHRAVQLVEAGEAFAPADMATASADGFRAGQASMSLPAAGQEPVATVFTMEALTPGGGVKYHATIHKPLPAGTKLYAAPQPAVAAGWVSVDDRLPEPDEPVLAHNGKWTGVAAWMSGEYLEPLERWQDEHREFIEMMGPAITHWMPLPPAPSTEGEGNG